VDALGESVHLRITNYNDNTGVAEDAPSIVLTIKALGGTRLERPSRTIA
jgi:hypothetical protein